ncbi:MAG TPA: hypothetical protein VK171_11485 [Fimbriimonas sp.]|nr:hypothetical protein [Fimbriimonas sp.]
MVLALAVASWAKLTYSPGDGFLGSWKSPSLDEVLIVDTLEKTVFDKSFKRTEPSHSTQLELEKLFDKGDFSSRYILALKTQVPRDLIAYPSVSVNATHRAFTTIRLSTGTMKHSLHLLPLPDLELGTPTVVRVTLPNGLWKVQFSSYFGKDQRVARWNPKITDEYALLYVDQLALGNKRRMLQGYSFITDFNDNSPPTIIATALPVESIRSYGGSRTFEGLRYHTQDLVADEQFELPARTIDPQPAKPELRSISGPVVLNGYRFNAEWDRYGRLLSEPKFSGRQPDAFRGSPGLTLKLALPGDWISSTIFLNGKPPANQPWGEVVEGEFVRSLYMSPERATKSVHVEFSAPIGPPVEFAQGTQSAGIKLTKIGAYRFVQQPGSPLRQVEFRAVDETSGPNGFPIDRQIRFLCRTLDEQGNVLSYNLAYATKEFGVYRSEIAGSFSKPLFSKLEVLSQRIRSHSIGTIALQPDLTQVTHAKS